MAAKELKIKLIKSPIGRIEKHKLCVKGLGFRKIHQTVTLEDTPSVRGMVNKIRDMVEIVEG
ncbi:MAG: 50S ribosomal protein L30 [Gammaproteobacteria bacterium]|jgi:large subunit ribosomal protein L30